MKKKDVKKKLIAMRRSFKRDYEDACRNDLDQTTKLIIKAKMITINQIIEELELNKKDI